MKKRGLLSALALIVLLVSMLHGDAVMTARAKSNRAISIEAEVLPSDRETYDVRLTVENQEEDWEGVVRLIVNEDYRRPSAYDTALSLPQGSRKQFVVRVPMNSVDSSDGTVIVTLLDRKGEETAKRQFNRLLIGQMDALSMGILSDVYSELTYMDMGGAEIFFYDNRYPVKLLELQQGNLEDELDALTFLVIDQYNTGILTQDELEAIEDWNLSGGVLVIGTGAYAEDTLGGFDDGYLGIEYREIPEQEDGDMQNDDTTAYVDLSQLTTVELKNTPDSYGGTSADYDTGAWMESMGDGSVCVLPYSLAELGRVNAFNWDYPQEDFVLRLLDRACDYTRSRYASSSSYYSDTSSYIRSMLGVVGNSNSVLNFGVLKGIVVLYVIFVGPVLYVILRFLKRRELYWIAVPVTAVLGIVLVFFAGRGFEVVSTKVYSVAVKDLSDSAKTMTYMHCYDANRREWDLRLAEGCEYAGALYNTAYYNGSSDESYYYHIKKEGDTVSIGINPGSNFEDSYFCMNTPESGDEVAGSLMSQNLAIDGSSESGLKGTVVNNTNQDIDYFAVVWNDSMYVFEGLPAGESCDLQNAITLYSTAASNNGYYYYSSYVYDFVRDYYDNKEYEKVSTLSALGVGIYRVFQVSEEDEFTVIGVTKNWNRAVDDNCNEMSYGCLYSIQ